MELLQAGRSQSELARARHAVFVWIVGWYNPQRLHSALGYRPPNEFEQINRAKSEQVPVATAISLALNSSALNRP